MCLAFMMAPVGAPHAQGAPQGCPKAHCDAANSGFINLPVPGGNPQVVWLRNSLVGEMAGSSQGLGCSSNGTFAVCSYAGESEVPEDPDDNVVAYNFNGNLPGNPKWRSFDSLTSSAYTSAPLVLSAGAAAHTIAVDSFRAIRFNDLGGEVWNTPLNPGGPNGGFGGTPISPVITTGGIVILATKHGPIYAIDNNDPDGPIIATKFIRLDGDGPNDYFETHKSVAVDGNRVYISMQHLSNADTELEAVDDLAWLVALDVNASAPNPADRLVKAWEYPFSTGVLSQVPPFAPGEGSKSSPMLMKVGNNGKNVIFFDGWYWDAADPNHPSPASAVPQIFAVQDDGGNARSLWFKQPPDVPTFAAFLPDPSGTSFWHVQQNSRFLVQRSTSQNGGQELQEVNLDTLILRPGVHVACAAMTIAGTAQDPYLITAARDFLGVDPSYLVAIRLRTPPTQVPTLAWRVALVPSLIPTGQFPLVSNGTSTRVVFTGMGAGVRAVGN